MMDLNVSVRAASKDAAYKAAVAQILVQCPAGLDPQFWTGHVSLALSALQDDPSRDVVCDIGVRAMDSLDRISVATLVYLKQR